MEIVKNSNLKTEKINLDYFDSPSETLAHKPSRMFSENNIILINTVSPIIKFLQIYIDKLPSLDKEAALDNIIYGIKVKRIIKNGDVYESMLYLCDHIEDEIIFLDTKREYEFRISLKNIVEISTGSNRGAFAKIKEKGKGVINKINNFNDELCVSLHFQRADSIDLYFYSLEMMNYFLAAVLFIYEQENEAKNVDKNEYNVKKLWKMYDRDHSGKMEIDEFSRFFKQMHINTFKSGIKVSGDRSIEAYFKLVDKDGSGQIDYNEFIEFFKEFTSGKEHESIFKKYTNGQNRMSAEGLFNFMTKEQKESIFFLEDAHRIMKENKANGGDLTLEEFRNLIINKMFCHVYDLEALNTEQDMSRPLHDYFIFSSHNTYLTKHQLYGESNVEMYNYAVINGCRLVELDCWDGDKEPIITHGHTFTSNIKFRDVLLNLRENSFKTSQSPILFSIEMHCGPDQQKMMAGMYRKILKDIYVLDHNNPPESYPSPDDLKGMFIIKEGRSKIKYDKNLYNDAFVLNKKSSTIFNIANNEKQGKDYEQQQQAEDLDDNEYEDIPNEDGIYPILIINPFAKNNNLIYLNGSHALKEQERNLQVSEGNINTSFSNSPSNKFEECNDKLKDEEENILILFKTPVLALRQTFLSDIKEVSVDYDVSSKFGNSFINPKESDLNSKRNNLKSQVSLLQLDFNSKESPTNIRSTYRRESNEYINNYKEESKRKKKKEKKKEEKTIKEIQELAGLIKIKFDWKNYNEEGHFQPWDCPSIKENKIEEIYKDYEKRKKIVNFCKNSFLKVYPKTSRIDSSNFDPVKSWICGAQIAAMNLQSLEEDHMLINTIFFKLNKSCGYVLKPDFLRRGCEYDRNYQHIKLKLSIQIISGINIQNCQKNGKAIEDFSLSCFIVGSWEDDSLNSKFLSKKYSKNLLNSVFEDENYSFDVYEPDLSFIFLKLISDGNIFARSCIPVSIIKEGLRVVPLYDHVCKEIEDSELIIRVKKENK